MIKSLSVTYCECVYGFYCDSYQTNSIQTLLLMFIRGNLYDYLDQKFILLHLLSYKQQIMLSQCYNKCDLLPSHLSPDKSLKNFVSTSKIISLKDSPKRSLKFLKTEPTSNGKFDSMITVQSPCFSLNLSPQVQRNYQYQPGSSLTERFFSPSNLNNFSSGIWNSYVCSPLRIKEERKEVAKNQIKITFNYEKISEKKTEDSIPSEKVEISQVNQQIVVSGQKIEVQQKVQPETEVKLTHIAEEKEDILSIEFGMNEHSQEEIDVGVQPKLAVSLMNSRYDKNSVVLEKPLKLDKLLKLT